MAFIPFKKTISNFLARRVGKAFGSKSINMILKNGGRIARTEAKATDNILVAGLKKALTPVTAPLRRLLYIAKAGKNPLRFTRINAIRQAGKMKLARSLARAAKKSRTFSGWKALGVAAAGVGFTFAGKMIWNKLTNADKIPRTMASAGDPTDMASPPSPEILKDIKDPSGAGTVAQIQAKQAAQQQVNSLEEKLVEAKSEALATRKALLNFKTPKQQSSDILPEVYAKSANISDQNDAIIQLLNRQNQLTNDSRIVSRERYHQEQNKIHSDLYRSNELYRNLMKMQTKMRSANNDYMTSITKEHADAVRQSTEAQLDSYKKMSAANKSSSMLKWALMGGLFAGITKITSMLGGVGNTFQAGFDYIGGAVHNLGEILGIIQEDKAKVAELDTDNSYKQSDVDTKGNSDGIVDEKDFANPDGGEVDKEQLANKGIYSTYDADNTMRGIAALSGTRAVYRTVKSSKNIYTAAKTSNEAIKAAGGIKNLPKYLIDKIKSGKVKPELSTVGKAGEEAAVKSTSWLGRSWAKLKKGGSELLNKVVGAPLAKAMNWATRKVIRGVAKIVGPKAAKVLVKFMTSLAKQSTKLAKAGSKFVPGVGVILGLGEAIYRGFKLGDWTGAAIAALGGIASTVPGMGTAVQLACDGILAYRDFTIEGDVEKESANIKTMMDDAQRNGFYKPGQKGNVYNEVIRKLSDMSNAYQQNLKNKVLKKLYEIDKKAKDENWNKIRKLVEMNSALDGTGIWYNPTKGTLNGIKPYDQNGGKNAKGGPKATWVPNTDKSRKLNYTEKAGSRIEPNKEIPVGDSPFGTGKTSISSNYLEEDPKTGKQHGGVDFTTPDRANVKHPYAGTIVNHGKTWIAVRNPDGTTSVYWHLKPMMSDGTPIKAGTIIGRTLTPSEDTSIEKSHIHYEVRKNYRKSDASANSGETINPLTALAGDSNSMAIMKVGSKGGPTQAGSQATSGIQQLDNNNLTSRRKAFWNNHRAQWFNVLKADGYNDADAGRIAGFLTAQDGFESAGGTSGAATLKHNFGGMQIQGKNVKYASTEEYMKAKLSMMKRKFGGSLKAKDITTFALSLGNTSLNRQLNNNGGQVYYTDDPAHYLKGTTSYYGGVWDGKIPQYDANLDKAFGGGLMASADGSSDASKETSLTSIIDELVNGFSSMSGDATLAKAFDNAGASNKIKSPTITNESDTPNEDVNKPKKSTSTPKTTVINRGGNINNNVENKTVYNFEKDNAKSNLLKG